MARAKRPLFNPGGPFVARRSFLFNGAMLTPGDAFDHTIAKVRKVRQLYDCRRIAFAEVLKVTPNLPESINWKELPERELIAYAFKETGKRCRKASTAIHAIEAFEKEGADSQKQVKLSLSEYEV